MTTKNQADRCTAHLKRVKDICAEFDSRADAVGVSFARLELAKAFAEREEKATKMESALKAIRTLAWNIQLGDSVFKMNPQDVLDLCNLALGEKT